MFVCETFLLIKLTLKSIPGINQYQAMKVKFLAQGNNGSLWWCLNQRLTNYEIES